MIQFTPEPLEKMKARYSYAVSDSNSVQAIHDGRAERASAKVSRVFDFEDGIRIIISRDHYMGTEVIHFSGSFVEEHYKGIKSATVMLPLMVQHFCELSGHSKESVRWIKLSDGGIPHWYVPLSNLN